MRVTLKHILPLALLAILIVGLVASQARASEDIANLAPVFPGTLPEVVNTVAKATRRR